MLTVIEKYNEALGLFDSYDHQTMKRPKGNATGYVLTYDECRKVISDMKFGNESDMFGREKDDSFRGSVVEIFTDLDVWRGIREVIEQINANAAA